ncbi:hypothetical protein [Pandoraea sp. CB10b_02]|uniref:hypothetical protein n=1 Tax=Pandoraea sp. CB10b_02 TaxID=2014535 RepID=UPI00257C1712|nr:hypothetical protein [Pandoraea sp. CB10b_02]
MTSKYAVIENGVVVNVALWDGEAECPILDGAVPLEPDSTVCPGYRYLDGAFFPPVPVVDLAAELMGR